MQATSITLETMGYSQTFNMSAPAQDDPYIITSITGLSNADVNVNYQKTLYNGSIHMGSRAEEREIVIEARLNPSYASGQTPADLRDNLYRHLIPEGINQNVYTRISIMVDNGKTLIARARLSHIESVLYTKQPAVQLTFKCNSPYLVETTYVRYSQSITTARVDFDIVNPGAPVGFYMFINNLKASPDAIYIANDTTSQHCNVTGLTSMTSTDNNFSVTFVTAQGSRMLSRTAYNSYAGTKQPLYRYMGSDEEYVMLASGSNHISVQSPSFTNGGFLSFQFNPRYWGV